MNKRHKFIKLDDWANELIVDPLSKEPLSLSKKGDTLLSQYGAVYPVVGGIYDLRLLQVDITSDTKLWKECQKKYEEWSDNWENYESTDFFSERAGVKEVYQAIPIVGRCLDVGGHQGRLRAFLTPDQEYLSCDPFISVFDPIEKSKKLIDAYPFILDPVNFVCCHAEHLPFSSLSFDTVHMRSVLDHFMSPELALKEASRVMAHDGQLVIGLYVHKGKNGLESFLEKSKRVVKDILPYLGCNRWIDPHTWHPTYSELINLLSICGFKVIKVHWQKGTNDRVCYLQAVKRKPEEA
jgi:SAM-dependent methyltransferase